MNEKSWSSVMSRRRRVFGDSECSESEKDILRDISEPSGFCGCSSLVPERSTKWKKKQNLLSEPSSLSKKLKNPYIEELEVRVANEELIERELCDKQTSSRQKLDDICDLLRTISLYSQSLNTRYKLSKRIQNLLLRIIPENDIKEHRSHCFKSTKELIVECDDEIQLPDSYYEILTDCNEKYKDFMRASSNFCRILTQDSISNSQLRKLEKQYETIRTSYSGSKALLSCQMDKMIESKISTLDKCLQQLIPAITQTIEGDKDVYNYIHELSLSDKLLNPKKSFNRFTNKSYKGIPEERCSCALRK